jgi:putative proteasome-type protease
MTYCVGLLVEDGLVMIADTRTNAGLDDVSTYRKLNVFWTPGERTLAIATAGNLSLTQSVLSLLQEGVLNEETDEVETLLSVPNMFRAAQLVGRAVRHIRNDHAGELQRANVSAEMSLLLGGQILGEPMKLYMIYSAGNFISCGVDAPYLQIGEHKYGKPILDRAITYQTELYDALKIGLISMDSTMRSNLGVGLPVDILALRRGSSEAEINRRIEAGEPYFHDLRERWSAALRQAHINIPRPPYGPHSQ